MYRVLILTNTLKTGGAEKQSIYLFNTLKEKFNTKVIVYYGNQVDQRMLDLLPDNSDKRIVFLRGSHFRKLIQIFKLFRQSDDTVCISYLATTNTINAIIGKITGVKIRIGGIRNSRFNWLKIIIQRHLHNYWLTCSIFNNHYGYEELISQGFKKEKGLVVFNCIDVPKKIKKEQNLNQINLLTVGRFVEQKDYITSLQSILELIKNGIDIKYTIVGQGHLEADLKEYVVKYDLVKHVEFIINPPNVNDYYKQADIYLSTSLFEGLSNSIMEAMSFGLPVVATDVGDNKYLIIDSESGFLVPLKDVERISSKLKILIANSYLRKEMGEKGYNHIKENFSEKKFANEYINLIEKLSNGK